MSLKRLCIINWKKKRLFTSVHSEVILTPIWAHFWDAYVRMSLCGHVSSFLLFLKGYWKGPVRTPAFLIHCERINLFSLWAAIAENYTPAKSWILLKIPLELIFLISFHHLLCFCRAAAQLGLWRACLILPEPLTLPTINMGLSNY